MNPLHDIHIKQWTSNAHKGLTLAQTQYSTFEFPPHFHTYYVLLVVEAGVNEGFTGKDRYTIEPGSLLIINPGEIHAGKSYQQQFLQFSSFLVEAAYMKEVLGKNGFTNSGDLVFPSLPIVQHTSGAQVSSLCQAFQEASLEGIEEAAADLFCRLIHDYNAQGKKLPLAQLDKGYIAKAKQYIEDHYDGSWELAQLAAHCDISPYHLIREFRRHIGLTPLAYLRNFRIERAKEMLQHKHSVTEIAHAVGFYDHSHFLRNFKKLTGMLPSQYR